MLRFHKASIHLSTQLNPTGAASYKVALEAIKNPVLACQQLYEKIEILVEQISELEADITNGGSLFHDNMKYECGLLSL